ncbi:unnamed protein product [Xylocopa violacea]|uniref:Uncharacterized protein n=1 Tax=Xylocopa violacea TaxID=135666 RepID=A0ABP1NT29_XYLVO
MVSRRRSHPQERIIILFPFLHKKRRKFETPITGWGGGGGGRVVPGFVLESQTPRSNSGELLAFLAATSRHNFVVESNTKGATAAEKEKTWKGPRQYGLRRSRFIEAEHRCISDGKHRNETKVTKRGRKIDEAEAEDW